MAPPTPVYSRSTRLFSLTCCFFLIDLASRFLRTRSFDYAPSRSVTGGLNHGVAGSETRLRGKIP
jgi:hypothetical protein